MTELKDPFIQKLKDAGHILALNEDGTVDVFRLDVGYHNGPECLLCGESWCQHCCLNHVIPQCASKNINLS